MQKTELEKPEKGGGDELFKELAIANKKNRDLEKKIRGYKGLLNRKNQKSDHKHEVKTEDNQEDPPKTVSKPHFVGKWQANCPDCGEKNPEFQDETECKDCKMHLGSIENMEKMKACPNCAGKGVWDIRGRKDKPKTE